MTKSFCLSIRTSFIEDQSRLIESFCLKHSQLPNEICSFIKENYIKNENGFAIKPLREGVSFRSQHFMFNKCFNCARFSCAKLPPLFKTEKEIFYASILINLSHYCLIYAFSAAQSFIISLTIPRKSIEAVLNGLFLQQLLVFELAKRYLLKTIIE